LSSLDTAFADDILIPKIVLAIGMILTPRSRFAALRTPGGILGLVRFSNPSDVETYAAEFAGDLG